jgi:uncharacterized protein with HEPN domain
MPSEVVAPTQTERLAWLAIRDNGLLAQSFIADMTATQFAADRRTFYAVTRCLEIISEAARRLRGIQQDQTPDIEWRQIEDSGNVFRHVYQHVAESRVWMTVKDRIPALIQAADGALTGTP